MMALRLKNDIEVKRAVQGSQDALDENCRALEEVLAYVYGAGGVAKDRIAKLLNDRGTDGKTDTGSL